MGFSSASKVHANGSQTFLSTAGNRKSNWICDFSSSSSYPKSYRGFLAWCWENFYDETCTQLLTVFIFDCSMNDVTFLQAA